MGEKHSPASGETKKEEGVVEPCYGKPGIEDFKSTT